MSWYIIKGLGPGFDGLIVEGEKNIAGTWVDVRQLVNRSIMFGDREFKVSFPDSAFSIHIRFLEPIADPGVREYDSKNPWGKYVCEGRLSRNNIEVSWAEYDYCTQVTVQEKLAGQPTKTLYTDNFHLDGIKHETIIDTINESIREDDSLDSLIFHLKELKNRG